MLTLDHHRVWKMQGLLSRMHREIEPPAPSTAVVEGSSPANRTAAHVV
tara:strand:+ start:1445 stop:1588 length:144 start_codon:yes stop_codon:yes gene_type:complete